MQAIGVNRCAIPPEELTTEALLEVRFEVESAGDDGPAEESSSLA